MMYGFARSLATIGQVVLERIPKFPFTDNSNELRINVDAKIILVS